MIENLLNLDLSDAIDACVRGERDRAMLKRKLIDLVTYESLAEEFDLSVSQTKRIIYKSQEQLFKRLNLWKTKITTPDKS